MGTEFNCLQIVQRYGTQTPISTDRHALCSSPKQKYRVLVNTNFQRTRHSKSFFPHCENCVRVPLSAKPSLAVLEALKIRYLCNPNNA